MEVRIDRDAQDLEDQITYLYKYGQINAIVGDQADNAYSFRPGRSITSYGSW